MSDEPVQSILLVDPGWSRAGDPPAEAVLGSWPLQPDGSTGLFSANPGFQPRDPDAASDPIDALCRLAARGDSRMDELQQLLRVSLVDLALTAGEAPLIVDSPDGVPCAVVATATVHRTHVPAVAWQRLDLAGVLARSGGLDLLINANGPAALRLTGPFLMSAAVR